MSNAPLMPIATAVWLVENTSLSFKQIAEFCKMHEVEIQGIADGEVGKGIVGYNPIMSGQLTREEIDLSSKDPFFVLPILMGLSMFIQQKLNPPPADPTQQKIFMFLPIIFTLLFATFPSGLVLYWFANNILSIAQQYVINKRLSV